MTVCGCVCVCVCVCVRMWVCACGCVRVDGWVLFEELKIVLYSDVLSFDLTRVCTKYLGCF